MIVTAPRLISSANQLRADAYSIPRLREAAEILGYIGWPARFWQ